MAEEKIVVVEVARHVRDFLITTYWSKSLEDEQAIRKFARIPGMQEAMTTFYRLEIPEVGTRDWKVSKAVAKDIYIHCKRSVKDGCPAAHAIAVIHLLDSLDPKSRQTEKVDEGSKESGESSPEENPAETEGEAGEGVEDPQ